MIIKSMSRKEPSFGQLVGYLEKVLHSKALYHNIYDIWLKSKWLARVFEKNSKHLAKRKKGNYLYHEVISLEVNRDTKVSKLEPILKEVGGMYLEKRARNQLAYWVIHKDTKNIHLHLCISANNIWDSRRVSLSKKKFKAIQQDIESYVIEHFPELGQSVIYNKKPVKENIKTSNTEQELKKRTHQLSKKEELKNLLHGIFENANTLKDLTRQLKQEKYSIYTRGKTKGVIHKETKRKYRLKTLWIFDHYEATCRRLEANKKQFITGEELNKNNKVDELNGLTEGKKYTLVHEKKHFLKPISMNSTQAKQLPLVEVLQKLWFWAHHATWKEVWYISPLREEKTPSFKVNLSLNTWYDFWRAEGGGIIELFMLLYNEQSVSKILTMIARLWNLPAPSIQRSQIKQNVKTPIIQKISAVKHSALIQYLSKRGLDVDLARLFLSEVHYQVGDQSYFWLASANIKQGFEVRNAYYKGCLGTKSISFIPGEEEGSKVAIFEGIYDFLSLLQIHKKAVPPYDAIIMNGVWLVEQVRQEVLKRDYKKIHMYLDNDLAWKKAFKKLSLLLPEHELKDFSWGYADFKDLNDYLVHRNQLKISLDVIRQEPWILLQADRERELLHNFNWVW